ncbi:MAG: bifunctional proline dehydrogenase/L-glutamate gamma-semialdehyde dehydrogenase, partial [Epibacterium sp.]|nr:bifunctional proline dehydrogenase/L-glutamate gamma-semialdehyde dehydrogenase [Epibacterium sp.]NQX72724.1 bifunctional proline dehydrogenase/L-glutamate gamma-semialdehyde dehydrogenase [Epibacterium sp.]
ADAQALLDRIPQPDRVILSETALPGPTGESNILATYGRGIVLCLGPTPEAAQSQATTARANGCRAAIIAPGAAGDHALDGALDLHDLSRLSGFQGVAFWGEDDDLRTARQALADRDGQLLPLWAEQDLADRCRLERHTCIDTTAAGGNASLLADAS